MAKCGVNMAIVAAIFMAAMVVTGNAALTCGTVTSNLTPCIPFIAGSAAQPTQACCSGVKSLNSAAKAIPDRKAACNCIKSSARSIGINFSKASKLPGLCGVNVGVPISASTNCAAIH